ncbi:MAG: hypothetical protein ACYS32_17430, partial [Planctomycetota bacterium]
MLSYILPPRSRFYWTIGLLTTMCLFSVSYAASQNFKPPWEGPYKIKPNEKDRLTPADIVGPDGLVYPNWTKCGVQGGIPSVKTFTTIEKFGGKANDNLDDSAALDQACRKAGDNGGGAVLLDEGTYYMDRPVTIRHNNIVIRGKGRNKTKLIFRYAIPKNGVGFYTPAPGSSVGKDTRIEIHCRPAGLMKMTIKADDVVIKRWDRSKHSGNSFACSTTGREITGKLANGTHTLKGIAEYKDGTKLTGQIEVVLDSSFSDRRSTPSSLAAITFQGRGQVGRKIKLSQDGKRGDLTLTLQSTQGLKAGDCLYLEAPATARWNKLTKNACKWGLYRCYEVSIKKIKGNVITIAQPLRIDFPTIDGAFVRKVVPIQKCGIENLSIEQTQNLWISTVLFHNAWNCWARGVKVKMCGRFPV